MRCREAGVRPSMGSVGDCFDNAMCESFFATLECELLDRRHSALDYLSPINYERSHDPSSQPQALRRPLNRGNSTRLERWILGWLRLSVSSMRIFSASVTEKYCSTSG